MRTGVADAVGVRAGSSSTVRESWKEEGRVLDISALAQTFKTSHVLTRHALA